jgi:hypothetical protein
MDPVGGAAADGGRDGDAQESHSLRAESASARVVACNDSHGNHCTMISARTVMAGLTAGLLAAGCGGRTEADESPGDAPACIWPVRFYSPAGEDLECRAARFLVVCFDPSGSPVTCLSSSPVVCTDPTVEGTDCVNACEPDAYALECPQEFGPVAGPAGDYFGCWSVPPGPGPLTQTCCPCQGER